MLSVALHDCCFVLFQEQARIRRVQMGGPVRRQYHPCPSRGDRARRHTLTVVGIEREDVLFGHGRHRRRNES
jgi:hypothetical protein